MDEIVFFNPGDAIANSRDFSEVMRSAQIYRTKDPLQSPLVIVKPTADDAAGFSVYFADDASKEANTDKTAYKVQKHV
ncbi:hypothetical protein ACFQ5M_08605 [Agrilactobacillus yilanensis]|uniref:Uncharacterized protein n=1 Tax=Agrilactobacillus yilanensis TaxID=2485997 RepID=A0ABW4J9N6_9LACO|nr:hypothetical protein [Agrilactobacillus yilanensis]